MKWFQHQANAHSNLKLQPIIEEFGWEGYGVYWVLCEIIAEQSQNYIITAKKKWKQSLFRMLQVDPQLLDKMLITFADQNLISKKWLNKGALAIPKMKEYSGNWTKRLQSNSVVTAEKLPLKKRIEENRREEKRIEKNRVTIIPQDIKLSQLLYDLIKKRTPNWYHKPDLEEWADEIRKLRVIDTQTPETIEKIIRWCQNDDFWAKNILSTAKLRKQFPTLLVQLNNQPKKPYYHGAPMRKSYGKWQVLEGGEWKDFADKESTITYK